MILEQQNPGHRLSGRGLVPNLDLSGVRQVPSLPRVLGAGALVVLQLFGNGCASPAKRMDATAEALGFTRSVVTTPVFAHRLYARLNEQPPPTLHVYLDGDGSPWLGRYVVSADPTPRNPMVLQLMAADPSPSVYLGRPCYHGLRAPRCTPKLWTQERYSEAVVASMTDALRQVIAMIGTRRVVLIGYSGGGTLAMLLAERLPETAAVLTVAGNLAVAQWAAYHRYSPLRGSLDPASRGALQAEVQQIHLAGGRDGNAPARLAEHVCKRQQSAWLIVFDEFDHTCCWRSIWPEVLQRTLNLPAGADAVDLCPLSGYPCRATFCGPGGGRDPRVR